MHARRLMLLIYLTVLPCLSEASYMSGFPPGFNIRNMVKHTDLIVHGKVVDTEFVFREHITSKYTTDITIAVDSVVKGTPNINKNTVKFMIEGGSGIHPRTGADLTVEAGHSPDFEIGETVLLFLRKSKRVEMNIPHDGYYVFYGRLGKRKVERNKVSIPYTFKRYIIDEYDGELTGKYIDTKKYIKLPVDLVIDIGKASLESYDSVVPLEDKIREVISNSSNRRNRTIPKSLTDELSQEAKRIKERN